GNCAFCDAAGISILWLLQIASGIFGDIDEGVLRQTLAAVDTGRDTAAIAVVGRLVVDVTGGEGAGEQLVFVFRCTAVDDAAGEVQSKVSPVDFSQIHLRKIKILKRCCRDIYFHFNQY
ncbi:hypothetical protein, partial [Herbaspirillum autotrophicum]|uniref:hypothetical protein n=1 Tax=Herbaspirillum autotrophicum TaxID=180195 RepID=UPI0018DC3442